MTNSLTGRVTTIYVEHVVDGYPDTGMHVDWMDHHILHHHHVVIVMLMPQLCDDELPHAHDGLV